MVPRSGTNQAKARSKEAALSSRTGISGVRAVMDQATEEILARLRETGRREPLPWDINHGWCVDWAELACARLPAAVMDEYDDPATGMLHTFVRLNGRCHDAECTEGTEDMTGLPVFASAPPLAAQWAWNDNYRDLTQVEPWYPSYLVIYEELAAAGRYPYDDCFKDRIPDIRARNEDTAIYLLQRLRSLHATQAWLTGHLAAGWRDPGIAGLDGTPARFTGVAEYAIYHPGSHATGLTVNGSGWREWENARLTRRNGSLVVLPGRNRTRGHTVSGKVIVKD